MNPHNPVPAPHDDPARRLVAQLGQLRAAAGTPSYRTLAARTNYSRSALWRATRGSRLPSREITVALARACGAEGTEWDRRWHAARAQVAASGLPAEGSAAPPAGAAAQKAARPARRRPRIWLVASLAAITAALGGVTAALSPSDASPPLAAPQPHASHGRPADGDDPYVDKCATDQQRLEYQNLYWPDKKLYGWLELYHSHICDASWGYIFGPNSARWSVTIVARRLPGNTVAPSTTNADDPPNSWGNLLSTRPGTCVRIEAFIAVGAIRGPTAVTSCEPDRQGGGISPPPTPPPPPPPGYAAGTPPTGA
jgi:hypothetical protein